MHISDTQSGRGLFYIGCHELSGPREGEPASHHELELSCVLSGEGTYSVEGGAPTAIFCICVPNKVLPIWSFISIRLSFGIPPRAISITVF